MTQTEAMLDAYPADLGGIDKQALAACIDACLVCAQTCTACADACLSEEMVAELRKCIRTDLDCADVCAATGSVLSRHTGYDANLTGAPRTGLRRGVQGVRRRVRPARRHARPLPHLRRCLPGL